MGWTTEEVTSATRAQPAVPATALGSAVYAAVCTDSRDVSADSLFVALRGPNHDAHIFVAAALESGATAALVERLPNSAPPERLLVVDDTQRSLGDLAAWTRRREPLRVVAITGSNGKTTTKEMLASICERTFADGVLKTHGNQNNLIGLPLTLLRRQGTEAVAVLEMGMNRLGEIARLTEIARPDVGVITNVGAAHLEGLGDLEGVARAKGELYAGMEDGTTIVANCEDERVSRLAAGFAGRCITFGRGGNVEARLLGEPHLDEIGFALSVDGGSVVLRLRFGGLHNVMNALAAAAAAHALEIPIDDIAAGLEAARPPAMRLQVEVLANGVTVINDSYNANPTSMEAGLRALVGSAAQGESEGRSGKTWAVLGEMRELGARSAVLHHELGQLAARLGVDVVVAVGSGSEEIVAGARQVSDKMDVRICPDAQAAAAEVCSGWGGGDVVLVKGSRGADTDPAVRRYGSRMAEVVAHLQEAGARG
jgi:UDP-N-acetylmuramoyl-tripeptide--D-alanyl-D-alanine ligase